MLMVIECIIIVTVFHEVAVKGLEEGVSFCILSSIYGPTTNSLRMGTQFVGLTKGQIEK